MQRARRAALHLAWHDRALLCTRDGALASHIHRRFINEDRDGSQMEELLERTVVKPQKKDAPTVLTTRREALSLYRAVLRSSLLFVWRNERGEPWRDVIRSSARTEFEAARHLRDAEAVNRLLITGRDCLEQTLDKFMKQRQRIIEEEERAIREGKRPGAASPPS